MARVSNEAIMTEIKSLHEKFDTFIEDDYKPLKLETKQNTEFRQKAYGVFIAVGAVWSFIVGVGVWFVDKIWGKN